MQRRVSYFDVEWTRSEQTGRVRLTFDDRSFEDLHPLSIEEVILLCSLLRSEKPVYYDPGTQRFSTVADRVGD